MQAQSVKQTSETVFTQPERAVDSACAEQTSQPARKATIITQTQKAAKTTPNYDFAGVAG